MLSLLSNLAINLIISGLWLVVTCGTDVYYCLGFQKQVTGPQKPHSVFSNLTKRLPSAHAPRTDHARPLVQHKTPTDVLGWYCFKKEQF